MQMGMGHTMVYVKSVIPRQNISGITEEPRTRIMQILMVQKVQIAQTVMNI